MAKSSRMVGFPRPISQVSFMLLFVSFFLVLNDFKYVTDLVLVSYSQSVFSQQLSFRICSSDNVLKTNQIKASLNRVLHGITKVKLYQFTCEIVQYNACGRHEQYRRGRHEQYRRGRHEQYRRGRHEQYRMVNMSSTEGVDTSST